MSEKIINGDFSARGFGWTVRNPTGGAGPEFLSTGFVAFNSSNEAAYGDSIEQNFTAAVGITQTVSMDLIENNGGVGDHTFQIDVLDDSGTVIASQTYVALNNSTTNVSFTFTPTTTTSTLRITNTSSTNTSSSDGKIDNVSITCFANGTLIETIDGPLPVEELKAGMFIKTVHDGFKPLRLTLCRKIRLQELENEKLRPICITAGSLGNNLPKSDLFVSRQHRMMVSSKASERMFGESDVLISAIKLVDLPGIFIDDKVEYIEYFHLVFDQHEIIFAEGAPTESFFIGPEALKTLSSDAREEMLNVFPEIEELDYTPRSACFIPPLKHQKKLVSRHIKNEKPMLQSETEA